MSNEYWIDDDGYIAYGTGDDYVTIAEIIAPQHIEPLTKIIELSKAIPTEDRYGREPEKVKPLAQYLDEYIEYEVELGNAHPDISLLYAYSCWQALLEQALDAYESTECVKIRIERDLM